jgi:hypothetical protein
MIKEGCPINATVVVPQKRLRVSRKMIQDNVDQSTTTIRQKRGTGGNAKALE